MKSNNTEQRQQYAEKMRELLPTLELEEGEIIKQCHEPYPPYWLITNRGNER